MDSYTRAMATTDIDDYQRTRQATHELFDGLTQAELDRKPAAGSWSVGEIFDHILIAERTFRLELEELRDLKAAGRRPYLDRAVTDLPFAAVDFVPRMLLPMIGAPLALFNAFVPSSLVQMFFRERVLPASAPPHLQPAEGRKAKALDKDLRDGQEQMVEFFHTPSLELKSFLYHHPLLGVVDAYQLLRTIASHEQRHQKQVREALSAIAA